MVAIKVHYNIPEGAYDSVRQAIANHMIPIPGNEDVMGIVDLENMRKGILSKPKWGALTVRSAFIWRHANDIVQDMGLFTDVDTGLLHSERYKLPISFDGDDYYRLEVYRTGCGEQKQLTFWLKCFMGCGGDTSLNTLMRLRKDLREGKDDDAIRDLAETIVKTRSFPPREREDLESITPILREVEREIEIRMAQELGRGFVSTIRALRYFNDFLGVAVRSVGYEPVKVEVPCVGEDASLSNDEMGQIVAFPHMSDAAIIESIFQPKYEESLEAVVH